VVHVPAYKSSVEAVVYATRGRAFFREWKTQRGFTAHNFIEGPSCMGRERERWGHPAQKPEYLIERFLYRHSEEVFWVLDPFMGVGTIPVVCYRMGRNCVGIDKEEEYYNRAKRRLWEASGNIRLPLF